MHFTVTGEGGPPLPGCKSVYGAVFTDIISANQLYFNYRSVV